MAVHDIQLIFFILILYYGIVAAVTNDCSQPSSNEAFLPTTTFNAHFTTLCNHTDGRKGGCSTKDYCDRYGGTHVEDDACVGQKCCLFDKKETPINKKTCFCMEPKYCTGATFSRLCPNSASAKCCSDESNELPECPKTELISYANFKKIYPSLSEQRATSYWPYINQGLSELGSTVTCHIKSSFFAQVCFQNIVMTMIMCTFQFYVPITLPIHIVYNALTLANTLHSFNK